MQLLVGCMHIIASNIILSQAGKLLVQRLDIFKFCFWGTEWVCEFREFQPKYKKR